MPSKAGDEGAVVTVVGEGAKGGYFKTALRNEVTFHRRIATEYRRTDFGCVLRVRGRRNAIEGVTRWMTSKAPGQGPGLSTAIESVDIAWLDAPPTSDDVGKGFADVSEVDDEAPTKEELIEIAKM